ncbi:MAG: hypothetical protein II007_04750 [Gammaproteobacteria bacterium]|nr:hypothetical protein [Gammaproteobacteria bacterium]
MFSRGEILPDKPKGTPASDSKIEIRDTRAEHAAAVAAAIAEREAQFQYRRRLLLAGIGLGIAVVITALVTLLLSYQRDSGDARTFGPPDDAPIADNTKVQDRVVMPGACLHLDDNGSCTAVVEYNVVWKDLKLADAHGVPQGDFAASIGKVTVSDYDGKSITVTVVLARPASKDLDVWLETTANRNGKAEYSHNLAFKQGEVERSATIEVPVRVQGYGRLDYRPVIFTANLSNVDPFGN